AFLAPAAMAWNKAGHMVSAGVAYQVLRHDHARVVTSAARLLQEHPFYNSVWRERLRGFPKQEHDLYLLMEAARWPDEIRNHQQFHHPEWHFINFPFKPEGQPRLLKTRGPDRENILAALDFNLSVVKDRHRRDADRAIALAWLLHLIGDLHQPLHTSSYFTVQFPQGDRGGTQFFIRAAPDRSVISLHTFWDDLILGSERHQSAWNRALLVSSNFTPRHLTELKNRRFQDWAEESFALSKDVAYQNGKLLGSADNRNVPILSASYREQAKRTAERRIVLSGYRIADLLLTLFR
ncbi:MAG TPA: S1/P1 nuclease, partial [Candidatus Hydrogenedentes bacterium]|nr:S1/P1 nuclease [Candidatus Hydrogenedentota bacterium]